MLSSAVFETETIQAVCNGHALDQLLSQGDFMGVRRLGFDRVEVTSSKDNAIHVDQFGILHRRRADCLFPVMLDSPSLDRAFARWEHKPNDVFLALCPGFNCAGELVAAVAALAGQMPQDSVAGAVCQPCAVELRVSRGDSPDRLAAVEGPTARCFVTRSPPWLLPGKLSGRGWAGSPAGRRGGKVVVLCADPRYLMLSSFQFWKLQPLVQVSGQEHPRLHEVAYLEDALRKNIVWAGGVFGAIAAWARIAAEDPGRVCFAFVEDILADPAAAMSRLADFLELDGCSAQVERATHRLQHAQEAGTVLRPGGRPGTDLQRMRGLACDFERYLTALQPGTRLLWDDLVATWKRLPDARLASLAGVMEDHGVWGSPPWWTAHLALSCKPCTFFTENRCGHGNECRFCHGPGHVRPKRPSKKERERRDRRRLRFRTPSPSGLST